LDLDTEILIPHSRESIDEADDSQNSQAFAPDEENRISLKTIFNITSFQPKSLEMYIKNLNLNKNDAFLTALESLLKPYFPLSEDLLPQAMHINGRLGLKPQSGTQSSLFYYEDRSNWFFDNLSIKLAGEQ